jgi:hypothetical protein
MMRISRPDAGAAWGGIPCLSMSKTMCLAHKETSLHHRKGFPCTGNFLFYRLKSHISIDPSSKHVGNTRHSKTGISDCADRVYPFYS